MLDRQGDEFFTLLLLSYSKVQPSLSCAELTLYRYISLLLITFFFSAQCKQGTYSSSGLETCESCPLGTYQPEFGSRSCLLCPEHTSTVKRGAVNISACGG
jgi:hypothetical protein